MGSHHSKGNKSDKFNYRQVGLTAKQFEALHKEWSKLVVDGRIPKERWIAVALATGDFDEELASLSFDSFDIDGNGLIDIEEYFTVAALSMNGTLEEKMIASFKVFDKDNDGLLNREELRMRLRALARTTSGTHLSPAESQAIDDKVEALLDEAFKTIDTEQDGQIDVQEYLNAFSNGEVVLRFMTALKV